MNISIAQATQEHTEKISRICAIGWRQTVQGVYSEKYIEENINYWYNHKRVSDDIAKGLYTHVAIVDNNVVGTIGGVVNDQRVSEIFVFYVDEAYRYQGIGTRLLDLFTKEHIKNGATEQFVSVQEGNDLGIPFYKSRGFQQIGPNDRYRRQLKLHKISSEK